MEVARAAEQGGAAAVALHGRTRNQMYSGRARWDLVALVKRSIEIPVLGSGDVFTAKDAQRMIAETAATPCWSPGGPAGTRGSSASWRPWSEARRPPPPTREEWLATVQEHVQRRIEHRGRLAHRGETPDEIERAAIRELRRHLLWYTRGRRGGVHFRRDADRLKTAADVNALFALHFPPGSANCELDPGYRASADEDGE